MAATIALNIAYGLYVATGFVKTELKLRIALIIVSVAFIIWGFVSSTWSAVIWNVLFGSTHAYRVIKMWRQNRSIQLDERAAAVHARIFPELNRLDFFTLWSIGTTTVHETDEVLIEQGADHKELALILGGQVTVDRDGERLAVLGADALLGERSYVTGQPASARVVASNEVTLHSWNQGEMAALVVLCPDAHAAVVAHIGVDLAAKLG